nr:DUF3841 domain-containing protein [Paenibacillus sp. BIHB 4019]
MWSLFENQGYLEGSEKHALFPQEYQWMMTKMNERLPNYSGESPIWLWVQKPDMRSSGHFESCTSCVRIRLELDDKEVLISDFDDWHLVLNDSFLADNEKEWDDYHLGKLSMSKEESWDRIFDFNRLRDPDWHGTDSRCSQGVAGRIHISRVNKVEHFVTRKQREI